jgi:uncharacterized protein (TIGR02996 family)
MQAELEQRILDNPDDIGAFAVYADWLIDRGDPRGALLQLQLQLEDPSLPPRRRQSLQDKERALLQEHARAWLGPLADVLLEDEDSVGWRFERGFLGRLDIRELTQPLAEALRAAEEQTRMLRHLSIHRCWDDDAMSTLWEVSFPNVRSLDYGDGTGSLSEEGTATMLAGTMARLEELTVSGRRVQTEGLVALPMPRLRSLSISCAYRFHTAGLAANPSLGELQSLALQPHAHEPGDSLSGYLGLADLEHLARSAHLRSLSKLALGQCTAGDEGCRVLVESELLGRLEELDLEYGEVTDAGAQILASSGQLGRLRALRLNANSLTERGVALLRAAGVPELRAGNQQQWGEGRGYLHYGDCE